MRRILSDDFITNLGIIRTWVESDLNDAVEERSALGILTKGHSITLQRFEIKNDWLPDTMAIESSCGWRWHIRKVNDQRERLTIYCKLINPSKNTRWDYSSGEHLYAMEIENDTHQLHMGTEDGEVLQARAETSNWMPNRFKKEFGFDRSFTEYKDFGFRTAIPDLFKHEKVYFHFLVATNPVRQSSQYPDERDVSTWYAVDQFKEFLDEKVGSNGS